jgi:N-carbamoylputrescine amidase
MKITVCETPNKETEFSEEWERLVRHVAREKSEFVLLPEMPFFHWFAEVQKFDPRVWRRAVVEHRLWMSRLPELGAPVVLATRPIDRNGKRLNEGFVWSRKRGSRGVHTKRYLPNEPGFYEASWYDRGDGRFAPFDAADWSVGFMICSDLWSMANARSYGRNGVDLIAAPRCTGVGSVEKWVAGGRVAAIISGAYCISSNRAGKGARTGFGGHGWVIDPNGDVLGLTSRERPFLTVEVDRSKAEKAKKTYPRDALRPD